MTSCLSATQALCLSLSLSLYVSVAKCPNHKSNLGTLYKTAGVPPENITAGTSTQCISQSPCLYAAHLFSSGSSIASAAQPDHVAVRWRKLQLEAVKAVLLRMAKTEGSSGHTLDSRFTKSLNGRRAYCAHPNLIGHTSKYFYLWIQNKVAANNFVIQTYQQRTTSVTS